MLRQARCHGAEKADLRRVKLWYAMVNPSWKTNALAQSSQLRASSAINTRATGQSMEWMMSKRLATEMKLSAAWQGNHVVHENAKIGTRLQISERLDFGKILVGACRQTPDHKTFTVSRCGRFLLTLTGPDIFVYRLFGRCGTIAPVVRLVASITDHNVVCVSMDTSSDRHVVGALLDNRTALAYDISHEIDISDAKAASSVGSLKVWPNSESPSDAELERAMATFVSGPRLGIRIEEPLQEREQPMNHSKRYLLGTNPPEKPLLGGMLLTESPQGGFDEDAIADDLLPIQARPKAIYVDLGTVEDPPRSIAVCPQRECLAIGCRTGIELHWTDALTGGDLARWFPLAAPSDHLFFLPQRSQHDSTRRLRLISSAQSPASPTVTRRGSLPSRLLRRKRTHDRGRRQSMTRLFFGNLPFPAAAVLPRSWRASLHEAENDDDGEDENRGVLRAVDCDHYHAVPISDGDHVLYTDPESGQLCLGSDAPVGAPTKLNRKVVMIAPVTTPGVDQETLMSCYTAASDYDWGLRIVTAFRDGRIVLYSIPSDVYYNLRRLRNSPDVWDETLGVFAQSDLLMDDALVPPSNAIAFGNEASRLSELTLGQPVIIEGVHIGHFDGEVIDDLAINADYGGLRVWVFCQKGKAILLDIFVEDDRLSRSRFVGADRCFNASIPEGGSGTRSCPRDISMKGKERADTVGAMDLLQEKGSPDMGYDGTIELDVNKIGGIWIDGTKKCHWKAWWPTHSDCPICDIIFNNSSGERVQIQVTGSAMQDRLISGEIMTQDELRVDGHVDIIAS